LSQLWNELVRDGEITTAGNNGLINSSGVLAKKGKEIFEYLNVIIAVKIKVYKIGVHLK
jgi:hypothetical protein